eukprot:1583524-Pyramimonas_sp.AAC.1
MGATDELVGFELKLLQSKPVWITIRINVAGETRIRDPGPQPSLLCLSVWACDEARRVCKLVAN